MTHSDSIRVVPLGGSRVVGELRSPTDQVVLVVPAHKHRLAIGKIKIKLADVGIVSGWRGGVKAVAAGVRAVAHRGVVGYISVRGTR